MKNQPLFTIPSSHITQTELRQYLSTTCKAGIDALFEAIKRQTGTLHSHHLHLYRVGRVNYARARLDGSAGQFFLTIELSGYTELPEPDEFSEPLSRLQINLSDATDTYWFFQLLQHELYPDVVDNPV